MNLAILIVIGAIDNELPVRKLKYQNVSSLEFFNI